MVKGILLFFILSTFFLSGCSQQTPGNSNQLTEEVTLTSIEATPIDGDTPLDVSFIIQLLQVEGHEENYYCPATTWDFGDGQRESIMPSCLPYEDVKDQDEIVQVFYTTRYTYTSSGTYEVRFTIQDLVSEPITITVRGSGTTSCNNDSDCVPAQCCHPTSVVNKQYAPDCTAVLCDQSCEGTLDCGKGKPVCKDRICVIQPSL
ncbi:MAG: hypothetical protein AABW64_02620 [Nanoarchaeota archaeon]